MLTLTQPLDPRQISRIRREISNVRFSLGRAERAAGRAQGLALSAGKTRTAPRLTAH